MPIYEFRCSGCRRKFRRLLGVTASSGPLACPTCKSTDVIRLISRFARVRTEDDTLEALADDMEALGEDADSGAMRRVMRDMGSALDDDGIDEEIDEMMSEAPESGDDL